MKQERANTTSRSPEEDKDNALRRIEEALRGLRFGTVTVIVQDGVIVQIERTDRVRLVNQGKKQT